MAFLDIFKRKKQKHEEAQQGRWRKKAREESRSKEKTAAAFSKSKEEKNTSAEVKSAKESEYASRILLAPHITEKSARFSERGTYVFRVKDRASKRDIAKAITELYGVHVAHVHIVWAPSKRRMHKGVAGVKPGYKKAIVALKKGEKIEFV